MATPEKTPETQKIFAFPGRNSTIDERLRFILQEENMSAANLHKELCEKTPVKRAYETVLSWVKKREDNTEPQIYISDIRALAELLRVNTLWLATGEGPYRDLDYYLRECGFEEPERKKIRSKKELRQHLSCIHYSNIPLYISDFDPSVYTGSVTLSPDTELTDFILARYDKKLKDGSGYYNLLTTVLNTSNYGLFPDWMISRFSSKGTKTLRMYYVRDSSMSPLLNESDLAVVNTDFQLYRIKQFLKTNHVYAFVSAFGYVFFRKVQINYNFTEVTLTGENCEPETVPLSEISVLPNAEKLVDDEMFFSYLELPPPVKEKIERCVKDKIPLDNTSGAMFETYKRLSKNQEYKDYIKQDSEKQKQEKRNLELQDIPRYKKLFLIGEVVYRRESLKPEADPAYTSFSSLFNNFRTIDSCIDD